MSYHHKMIDPTCGSNPINSNPRHSITRIGANWLLLSAVYAVTGEATSNLADDSRRQFLHLHTKLAFESFPAVNECSSWDPSISAKVTRSGNDIRSDWQWPSLDAPHYSYCILPDTVLVTGSACKIGVPPWITIRNPRLQVWDLWHFLVLLWLIIVISVFVLVSVL